MRRGQFERLRAQPMTKTAVNSRSRLSIPVTNAAVIISAAAAVDAVRGAYDQSAIVSVCNMTDQKGKHDSGDELNEVENGRGPRRC